MTTPKKTNRHLRAAKLRGKFITSEKSRPARAQHKRPCSDCPWQRTSIRGWTGSATPDEWLQLAHGEATAECHVHTGVHCAGLAIYRANVGKTLRAPNSFELPADTATCFGRPQEFREHHDIFPSRAAKKDRT